MATKHCSRCGRGKTIQPFTSSSISYYICRECSEEIKKNAPVSKLKVTTVLKFTKHRKVF